MKKTVALTHSTRRGALTGDAEDVALPLVAEVVALDLSGHALVEERPAVHPRSALKSVGGESKRTDVGEEKFSVNEILCITMDQ
jgi:hypothetical protein